MRSFLPTFLLAAVAPALVLAAEGQEASSGWFRDANATRLFYSPTGLMLRKGESYFSQKELLYSSFGYGLTDNVSVTAGTVVPLWFVERMQHVMVDVKVGTDLGDLVHVSAGGQGLLLPLRTMQGGGIAEVGGIGYGVLTIGKPDLSFTLAAAVAISNINSTRWTVVPALVVGGTYRVTANVALVTENCFMPELEGLPLVREPFVIVNSVGVRLMGEHFAANLGVVRFSESSVPYPWLDLVYTFGG